VYNICFPFPFFFPRASGGASVAAGVPAALCVAPVAGLLLAPPPAPQALAEGGCSPLIFFSDWIPEIASFGIFLVFELGGNPGKTFSFLIGSGLGDFEDKLPPPPPAVTRGSLGTKTILLLEGGGGRETGTPCKLHAVDE